MAILAIRIYPDPVLRVKCRPVETFDAGLRKLAANMVDTMHAAPGVGLAAPQVGVDLRLAVVDISVGEDPAEVRVLVNPEIVRREGVETDTEGCLSLPGITDKVDRPFSITLRAQDLEGKPFELEADDYLARAICHEVDHLDGILFTDHLRGLRKERSKRQLKKSGGRAGGAGLRRLSGLALLLTLLLTACGGGGGSTTEPPPPPPPVAGITFTAQGAPAANSLYLASGAATTASTLVLELRANQVTDLYGVAFDLTYPSTQLQYVRVTAGPLLGNGAVQAAVSSPGTLIIGGTHLGTTPGANGSGVVLTLEFSAAASGSGSFAFTRNSASIPPAGPSPGSPGSPAP